MSTGAGSPENIVLAIRRLTGDTDVTNYRIKTQEMMYFLQDAVYEVQAELDFGYDLTVSAGSAEWNKDMYSSPLVFFKLKALELVLENRMHDNLFDGGNVQVGDIKVDVTSILRVRESNLKRVRDNYDRLLKNFKMSSSIGQLIDTYVTGMINNTNISDWVIAEAFL